nr:MAG TPA: hypothetical protein [Caudoviricetes sp.]
MGIWVKYGGWGFKILDFRFKIEIQAKSFRSTELF